jgi:alpha-glucosidase
VTSYFGFTLPLRAFLGQRDDFIYGSGAAPEIVSPLSARELGERILEHYQGLPGLLPYFQLNLLDSHDLPRLHTMPEIYHPEIYRSAVILQYLLPGSPCLYYGDEVGLGGWTGSPEGARFPMEWREDRWNREFLELYKKLNQLKA